MSGANFVSEALRRETFWGMPSEALEALKTQDTKGGLPSGAGRTPEQAASEAQTVAGHAASLDYIRRGQGYLAEVLPETMPDGKSIAVLNFSGTLISNCPLWAANYGYISPQLFAAELTALANNASIGAVVINMDCNGGTVTGTVEAAEAVAYAAKKKKVITVASDMALSAAYWIAAQSSSIVVSPTALLGSIGIITAHYDYSGYYGVLGIVVNYIRSVPGKARGQAAEPLTEEARAERQATVDALHAQFVLAVSQGRKYAKTKVAKEWATGQVWVGGDAVAAGLADRTASLSTILAELTGKAVAPPAVTKSDNAAPVEDKEGEDEGDDAKALASGSSSVEAAGVISSNEGGVTNTLALGAEVKDDDHKGNSVTEVTSMDISKVVAKFSAGQSLTEAEKTALKAHLDAQPVASASGVDTAKLDPAVASVLAAAENRAAAAEAKAKELEEKEINKTYADKAVALGQPAAFGPTLRKVCEALAGDPTALAEYERSVKATAAQQKLTTEVGTINTAAAEQEQGTLAQQYAARVKAEIDADPTLSHVAAGERVFKKDPAFAQRYARGG